MLSVTQLLHALSFVLRIIFHKKRVMLHTIITPALHTNIFFYGNCFSLRVILSGNRLMRHRHFGITHSWVTCPKCFGEFIWAKITRKIAENYTKLFWKKFRQKLKGSFYRG